MQTTLAQDYASLLEDKDTKRKKILLLKKCQKEMIERISDLNDTKFGYLHGEKITPKMKTDAEIELNLINKMLDNKDDIAIYRIYKDGKIIFTDISIGDLEVYKFMLRHQSQSVHHATKYEGYKITYQKLDQNSETKYC
jgi:hypothetical protein